MVSGMFTKDYLAAYFAICPPQYLFDKSASKNLEMQSATKNYANLYFC